MAYNKCTYATFVATNISNLLNITILEKYAYTILNALLGLMIASFLNKAIPILYSIF